eukprot:m.1177648 g.1177648  ORF g.1177648 m.1177648 type:complete len:193 (+) comp24524_c0_seq49:671-1249(+)
MCNVSICTGYSAVQCEPDDLSLACQIWCRGDGWGNGSECVSTLDTQNRPNGFMPTSGVRLRAGFSCAQMRGYCDQGGECVVVESEDKLAELEDRLKQALNAKAVWNWIKSNWLRSAGILLGVVALGFLLYRTRRRKPKRSRGGEYDPLLDSGEGNSPAPGSGGRGSNATGDAQKPSNLKRKGTVFENANSKF